MRSLSSISLCLLLVAGSVGGQQTEPTVALKLARPGYLAPDAAAAIQAKIVDLLKTSNFNSVDHPGPIFPEGVRGVHRRYRATIGGQYLVMVFAEPRRFDLVRGHATAIEVIVGLNDPRNVDAVFTIDPDGRLVEHSKFSGTLGTELMELVRKTENVR